MKKILILVVLVLTIIATILMLRNQHQPLTTSAVSSAVIPGALAEWPIFRGNRQLTGYLKSLPVNPKVAWTFRAKAMVEAGLVGRGDKLYFGDTEGNFYCLNINTGKAVWEKKISDGINASALLVNGVCYIGCQSGEFIALSMNDGKILWRYKVEGQISGSANYFMEQQALRIVFGSYDFKLHCLDAQTGKALWTVPTGNYINGAPAVADNRIIFGGCDGYLRTINALTGQKKYKLKFKSYIPASPVIYDSVIYVALYGQKVFAIDHNNKILWNYDAGNDAAPFLSSPAVNHEVVVIAARDGLVSVLKRADGKKITDFQTSGDITIGPIISDHRALVTDKDGFIYIFDLATGKEIWQQQLGPAITAPIANCGNKIIIADNDGNITAFAK